MNEHDTNRLLVKARELLPKYGGGGGVAPGVGELMALNQAALVLGIDFDPTDAAALVEALAGPPFAFVVALSPDELDCLITAFDRFDGERSKNGFGLQAALNSEEARRARLDLPVVYGGSDG